VRCGEEGWAVKTLSDKRERLVNFKPKDTMVSRLPKKSAPGVGRIHRGQRGRDDDLADQG
jgi:hypothetical protein